MTTRRTWPQSPAQSALLLLLLLPSLLLLGAASAVEDPAKCSACEAVAGDLAKLNATTSTPAIIKLLESEYCNVVYAHSAAKRLACDAAAKGLGAAYAAARKEIASLAWSPSNICGVAGLCSFDCCNASNVPEQVHLSLTGEPSEMTAMWTTLRQTTDHVVQWGTAPGKLSSQSDAAAGASSTYTHFGWIGMFHRAAMTGLAPGTRYYYRVGSANASLWSQEFSFRTLPDPSDNATLVVASVGDMGYGPASDDTVMRLTELVAAEKIDIVVHNGDISYADGDYTHWDIFMRKIEPVAAQVPYMVSPGNHEFYFNFSAYKHRFYMPDRGANNGLYYAFRAGAANFVAMDTESWWDTARMDKREVSFVEAHIDASARWNVVYGHRPLLRLKPRRQRLPSRGLCAAQGDRKHPRAG